MRLQRTSAITVACIALASALWVGATFVLLGDTGKFSDDYIAHLISPLTGDVDWSRHPWTRWPYFWRPLHLVHVYVVNTISFDRPWIGHIELALVHLGVSVLLYRVMATFGVHRFIAWSVAVLFMVCPLHAEAVLWTSASCNAISCLFLLWIVLMVRRQAAEPPTVLRLVSVFLLAFVIACWYEPAAAALLALPIVARSGVAPGLRTSERLRRVWLPTIVAGAACALYVVLLLITAPGGARGEAGSMVPVAQLPARITHFVPQVFDALVGTRAQDVMLGALSVGTQSTGYSELVWRWALLFPAIIALLACGLRWVFRASVVRSAHAPGAGLLIPCGWLIAAGALLPVMLTQSPAIDLRTLYVPLLGVSMVAAGVCDLVQRRVLLLHPKSVPIVLGGVLLIVGPLWAMGGIGFQVGLREQARLDASTVESLRALGGEPPADAVFLPLILDRTPVKTGRQGFDEFFRGAFELPSAITPVLRDAFRRREIAGIALTYRLNGDAPIHALTPSGFEIRRVRGGAAEGTVRIAWTRVRPFTLDEAGVLRGVSSMSVIPLNGEPFEVRTSQIGGEDLELQELPGRATRVRRRLP